MSRFLAFGTVIVLLAAPALAPAADKPAKPSGPSLIVRLQSVSQLIENADYMVDIFGQKDTVGPFLGFLKALISDKTVEGVDTRKPFILYGSIGDRIDNTEFVVMVPIADKDEFQKLLKEKAKLEVVDEKGGVFSTTIPNVPGTVYFRFANNYVYLTMLNKAALDQKRLPNPEEVAGKGDGLLSVGFRLDRVPEQMKQFVLAGVETALASVKDRQLPNETENTRALKNKAVDSLSEAVKAILFEGKELTIKFDVQPKKDELAFEFELSAIEGSPLAREFADLKAKKSVAFGSLTSNKAALLVAANLSLPESVKKVLGPAIDDLVKGGLEMADGDTQTALVPLAKSFLPTLKSGDFDSGFVLIGPDGNGKYTAVTGGKLSEGKGVEKAVREIVKKLPEPAQAAFELDAETVGAYKFHCIKVKDQIPDDVKSVFGESDIWIAFRDDAALIAFGPDAKKALKESLDQMPGRSPLIKAEFSWMRMMPFFESQEPKAGRDPKADEKIAQKVFGKNPSGNDTMSLTVEGGDSMRIRMAVKGKIVKYLVMLEQAKKAFKKKA